MSNQFDAPLEGPDLPEREAPNCYECDEPLPDFQDWEFEIVLEEREDIPTWYIHCPECGTMNVQEA